MTRVSSTQSVPHPTQLERKLWPTLISAWFQSWLPKAMAERIKTLTLVENICADIFWKLIPGGRFKVDNWKYKNHFTSTQHIQLTYFMVKLEKITLNISFFKMKDTYRLYDTLWVYKKKQRSALQGNLRPLTSVRHAPHIRRNAPSSPDTHTNPPTAMLSPHFLMWQSFWGICKTVGDAFYPNYCPCIVLYL